MIWAMGDLHLDFSGEKPMDIFGDNWEGHEDKIFSHWKEKVKEEDIVLLVGDISWALRLEEAVNDLRKIDQLPGKKFIIKGNHDYWWSSMAKLKDLDLKSLSFIHNNAYIEDGVGLCGTRAWSDIDSPVRDEQDQKIYSRELMRLQMSIDSMRQMEKSKTIDTSIALLHYPPFNSKGESNDFARLLSENHIDLCLYGHLHGYGHKFIVEGNIDGVSYRCVSSDYIDFKVYPVK